MRRFKGVRFSIRRVRLLGWAIAGAAFVAAGTASAQVDVGASFDCFLGTCDANTSDQGGDHHNVDLSEHLAEARAQGNGALQRHAASEVGLRFRPCVTGRVSLGMHDIDIIGQLRGFGGTQVIRGEVEVRTILRDITDDLELSNEVIFEREERGRVATTVHRNIDVSQENFITANLVANHVYDFVLRVFARKFGAGGRSDFQTGDRGVSFDRISIYPDLTDTDGDGLFDQWEISGIDEDCDGDPEVDLPAIGADPNVKDVFLELDWMTGQEPTQAAVRAVVVAFAQAPPGAGGVTTPGQGINLRVDTGNLTDPAASEDGAAGANSCGDGSDNGGGDGADQADADCLVGALVFSNLPGGGGLGEGNGFPVGGIPNVNVDTDGDGESDFQEAKFDPARGDFDRARLRAFRYAINAVAGGPPPNLGGQTNGNDFVLFNQNAGLLMHELGHTLGLDHGGPYDDDTNAVNCKPNYVSVMNYRFQGGIMVAGGVGNGQDIDGDGTGDGFILDYSPPRFPNGRGLAPLGPVDETAWSEANAFDVSDPANFTTWTTGNQTLAPPSQLNTPPDWNNDGGPNDQAPPTIDFNTAFWNPAANEGGGPANSCSDGLDNNSDGLVDVNDPTCIGNRRCGLPANASVTAYGGADDWTNLTLDPQRLAQADDADIPMWVDEPSAEEIEFVRKSMQTTDLAVSQKIAAPDPVVAGQPLSYTMIVQNLGRSPTFEAILVDRLPAELHFLGGEPSCAETGAGTVECVVGGLSPGETRDVVINTRVSVDVRCTPGEQFARLLNSARVENRQGFEVDPSNSVTRVSSGVLCAKYEYSAKFVCGLQDDPEDARLVTSAYRTTVNIHNPNDEETHFFKKLALTFPPERQRPGRVVPIAIDRLGYDEALKVDCAEARRLYGQNGSGAGYIEGYLVVQSPLSLDVDAVYTAEALAREGRAGSTSIDVEPVDERVREPGPLPDLVVEPALPKPPFDDEFDFQLPEGVPNALFCGPSGPGGGPARTVEAVVRNIGEGDAAASELLVEFQGAGNASAKVGALAAGQSVEISVDIPSGCYGHAACVFELAADASASVAETDEANNTAESLCLRPAG